MSENAATVETFRWDRYAPTRARLKIVFGLWGAIAVLSALAMYAAVLMGASGAMIGGDFSAFFIAARAAAEGAAAQIYDPTLFQERLNTAFPGRDDLTLTWQYPPTYFLIAAPFAALPYLPGYTLWSGATALFFALLIRRRTEDPIIFFGVLSAPAFFAAFVTGQNGFLTAALLLLAAQNPKSRPVIAGLAAGLLTVKPHLGLLIPIAYIAAGCWRAVSIAIVTAAALAGASILAYGLAPWAEFLGAVIDVGGRVASGVMPLAKMTTPYSAALFAGLPDMVAKLIALIAMIGAGAFIWRVWRKIDDPALRASALIAGVFIAAPYGFYYELIALAYPCVIIAARGVKTGWLKYERWLLAGAWALPAGVTALADMRQGPSLGFVIIAIVLVMTARRAHAERADLFPWAPPKPADDQKDRRAFIAAESVPSSR
ncbi:MAG: glycosyltransferase family 87 protein [Pseudomonadota bacterium]